MRAREAVQGPAQTEPRGPRTSQGPSREESMAAASRSHGPRLAAKTRSGATERRQGADKEPRSEGAKTFLRRKALLMFLSFPTNISSCGAKDPAARRDTRASLRLGLGPESRPGPSNHTMSVSDHASCMVLSGSASEPPLVPESRLWCKPAACACAACRVRASGPVPAP